MKHIQKNSMTIERVEGVRGISQQNIFGTLISKNLIVWMAASRPAH